MCSVFTVPPVVVGLRKRGNYVAEYYRLRSKERGFHGTAWFHLKCTETPKKIDVHMYNESELNIIFCFVPYSVFHKTRFTTPLSPHYHSKELPYCRRMCEWKSSHRLSKVHCTQRRWWVGVLRWQENWNGTPRTCRLHAIPSWRHRFFWVWLHPFMSARLSSFCVICPDSFIMLKSTIFPAAFFADSAKRGLLLSINVYSPLSLLGTHWKPGPLFLKENQMYNCLYDAFPSKDTVQFLRPSGMCKSIQWRQISTVHF